MLMIVVEIAGPLLHPAIPVHAGRGIPSLEGDVKRAVLGSYEAGAEMTMTRTPFW